MAYTERARIRRNECESNEYEPQDSGAQQKVQHQRSPNDWRFEAGQCVTHKDQPMPSIVLWRTYTSNALGEGHELYALRSFAFEDDNRDRLMLGKVLIAGVPGSDTCQQCMLNENGLCPGLR